MVLDADMFMSKALHQPLTYALLKALCPGPLLFDDGPNEHDLLQPGMAPDRRKINSDWLMFPQSHISLFAFSSK